MKYFVIPRTGDGCDLPTQPEPVELDEVSGNIRRWLARYERQGYYFNSCMARVPLDQIVFQVVPEEVGL